VQTPAAWLTTVVQRQSIDRLRQRARDEAAASRAMDLAPSSSPAPPDDALLRRAELGEALARMLARLSPAERMALVLREVFDCEHADIAAALGTTAANARQHLARARRRLREDGIDDKAGVSVDQKHCRDLVRRFQAAINGLDLPAMTTLLADEQPLSVLRPLPGPRQPRRAEASANDASYALALAA
jgi:predicted RNA polymerase sigma factor